MLISIGPGKWLNLQRILRAETKGSDSVQITYDVPHPHTKFVSETFTGAEAKALVDAIARNDDTHQRDFEQRMMAKIGPMSGSTGGATQAASPAPGGGPGNALEGEAGGLKDAGEGVGGGEEGAGEAGAAAGAAGAAAGAPGGAAGGRKAGSATAAAKRAAGGGVPDVDLSGAGTAAKA